MTTSDVTIRGVSKKFGTNVVLQNINLDIKHGELLTLLGPSGCGKTTTLNAIAGFLDPDEGELYIKGKKVNGVPPYKRDLGMVFQTYSLFPHMTVHENLVFGLKLRKIKKGELDSRISRALALVKLTGLEKRYPRELSGGQRQRVAIARALVVEPELLLLDEPLSNLDAKLRHELRAEIKRLQKEVGVTTIFVTHDQEEALSMSDRIVVMNQGKIEQIGTPTDIYQNPQSEFVFQFIGKSNRFEGVVIEADADHTDVEITEGWVVKTKKQNAIGNDRAFHVGDAVNLYIRPEAISIMSDDHGHSGADSEHVRQKAVIKQMNYLGSQWEIEVSVKGQYNVQIVGPTIENSWQVGTEVLVEWKTSDIRLTKR
ncbi:ABC transporter ATP-binding protein [Neobacillus novalis]|uniref:ABC transporter ATP-binding protein n=1 Tax=Neobacillus novalis TaxID=220687 RepID=A0AA95ML41_9BACI|nr:ABC transporter ATP-binding protein [Neobacillus novalis]WHY85957.1 ABC transporter ATP-binding protein [Neobacillus novalis]